jgi:hypothetical protein
MQGQESLTHTPVYRTRDHLHITQHAVEGSVTHTPACRAGITYTYQKFRTGISYTYPSMQRRDQLHVPKHAGQGSLTHTPACRARDILHIQQNEGQESLTQPPRCRARNFIYECFFNYVHGLLGRQKNKDISKLEKTIDLMLAVKNKESFNTLSYNY